MTSAGGKTEQMALPGRLCRPGRDGRRRSEKRHSVVADAEIEPADHANAEPARDDERREHDEFVRDRVGDFDKKRPVASGAHEMIQDRPDPSPALIGGRMTRGFELRPKRFGILEAQCRRAVKAGGGGKRLRYDGAFEMVRGSRLVRHDDAFA